MPDNTAPQTNLEDAIRNFANELADKVNRFATNVASLEVRTLVADPGDLQTLVTTSDADVDKFVTDGKASLRAVTKISFDGDMVVLVPATGTGAIDQPLWAIHETMVKQAQDNRAAMIQALGDAAASVFRALREAGRAPGP